MRAPYPDEAIFYQDEMRAGTRTDLGRRWGPRGHRPLGRIRIGYEFTYRNACRLYLSVCPFTGQGYAAFLPALNKASWGWFVGQMQPGGVPQAVEGQPLLLIADGASAHHLDDTQQSTIELVRLPAACPELNPIERFFLELRRQLKCRVFDTLQAAEEALRQAVEVVGQTAEKIIKLTCFPYLKNTSTCS